MTSKPLSASAEEFIPSAVVHYFAPPPYIKQYFPAPQPIHYYYPYITTPCYFIKTPTSNSSLFSGRQLINSQPDTHYSVDGYTKSNNSFGFKFGRTKFPSRFRRSNQIFIPRPPPPTKKLWHPRGNQRSSFKSKPEIYNEKPNGIKTTLMIRNIPNQLRRHDFLHFLKMHCQNQKSETDEIEFDFLYLPMDFRKHKNLGYAFVNWTTESAASRVSEILNNWKWSSLFPSVKVCKIDWARIQGKDALLSRFKNTCFECLDSEYLPIVLSSPGKSEGEEFTTVGRCVPPSDRNRARV